MPDIDNNIVNANMEEEVNFIEVNAEDILNRLLSRFEYYTGDVLYEGDERRIFLQGLAYVLADESNHINETGRGNLLRYATGNELNAIAEMFGNERLEAEKATVTLAFTIYQSMDEAITIPAGTRATPDGIHLFATDVDIVFEPNTESLSRDVASTAVEAGTEYNGFIAGQINRLVDINPYVYSVNNTDESRGGTDIESDDNFRERLRLAPFNFAVAGPADSYKSIALAVSNQIADVNVYSPSAGVVEIAVVLLGGEIPEAGDELLTEILNACSDKTKRPLTDLVRVIPAEGVNIAINVNYYVANGDTSVIPNIVSALNDYEEWQTEKIGRSINPDYLKKTLMDAGAARVEVISPAFANINDNQIANITSVNLTYSGSIVM